MRWQSKELVKVELEGGVEKFHSLTACDEAELILKNFPSSIKHRRGIIRVTTTHTTTRTCEFYFEKDKTAREEKFSFQIRLKRKICLSYDRRSDENLNEMKIT